MKETNNSDSLNPTSKTDLAEVLRRGNDSEYCLKLKQHFGEINTLVEIQQEWPIFEGNNARYHLETFMEAEGYTLELFSHVDNGSLYPSRFSDIEYAPDKYKVCIEDGSFFITHKDNKDLSFLLTSRTSKYERTYDIGIIANKQSVEIAKSLVRDFRKYILDNNIYKKQRVHGDLSFIKQDKKYSWEDLVLDAKTSKLLSHNLLTVLNKRELYNSLGISSKRGVILSGEPGTGKTMVGKILCSTLLDWSFIWVSPGDLTRVENLKAYCQLAKSIAPTVLFLEDLDLHFQSRDSNSQNSLLGELMNQLDGIDDVSNIVVVGTTNRPGDLENALAKRPGRFDKVIKFEKPEASVIQLMFKRFGGDRVGQVDWEPVLREAKGFTGAQIKEVLSQAVLVVLDSSSYKEGTSINLGTEDLLTAIKLCKNKDFSPSPVGFTGTDDNDLLDMK